MNESKKQFVELSSKILDIASKYEYIIAVASLESVKTGILMSSYSQAKEDTAKSKARLEEEFK